MEQVGRHGRGEPGGDGGVVHEDVDVAQGVEGLPGQLGRCDGVTQVGGEDDGVVVQLGRDRREPLLVPGDQRHPGTGPVERPCRRRPDATGGPGDDGSPPGQRERFHAGDP
ncbi:MAG TPA: hypothetical protein VK611_27050 [Acidimicrobiales bacterium]|nr:hypothetical protein [Acidimicrobiales bacterium]